MLELHVLNSGIGDTQLIQLPDKRWGLVDCYSSSTKASSHSVLALIAKYGISSLEFVCLTHPHHDHYRGLFSVLEAVPVKRFWRFGGMSGTDLMRYAKARKVMAAVGIDGHTEEEANELTKILAWPHKNTNNQIKYCRLEGYQDLMDGVDDQGTKFAVHSIAPTSYCVSEYESAIASLFVQSPTGKLELKESNPNRVFSHNKISAALVIQYGAHLLVLGGDVENKSWSRVLEDKEGWLSAAKVIKVSHHGSNNGMPEQFWKAVVTAKPWSVVTPYTRHNLPDGTALQIIGKYSEKLFLTAPLGDTQKKSVSLPPQLSSAQRIALLNTCKSMRKIEDMPPPQRSVGICTLRLTRDGERESSCRNGAMLYSQSTA